MGQPHILVVDSDEGFGNMLQQGLNGSGYYEAECVHTGRSAMERIQKTAVDLVIIDMGLADVSPVKLIKAIRKAYTEMRIMLIPLMGQDLPDRMEELLNIDGVLSKPFFVGDLPDIVNKALGIEGLPTPPPPLPTASPPDEAAKSTPESETSEAQDLPPMTAPAIALSVVPQQVVSFLRANEAEILRLLNDLNREVRAEGILLIAGQELIAHAGLLSRERCRELALLVAQSSQAGSQAAEFLGEKAKRFSQSLHEGEDYRVYTLTLNEGVLLSLALSSNVPLGMIRHQCRQIGEQISKFM